MPPSPDMLPSEKFHSSAASVKRLQMILMGGAGLILLGGSGALLGLNAKLGGLQKAAFQKEQEVSSNEQIARHYDTTLETYTQTSGRIQQLEASVSPKSYVPTLLKQLGGLASQTHLTVTAVRPVAAPPPPPPPKETNDDGTAKQAKKAPPPPYDTLNIDVDTVGTYADTAAFLYSLTRFPKIIALVGAQMHPNPQPKDGPAGAAPTVTTNLKLVAFMFHQEDAGTPEVTLTALPTPGLPAAPPPAAPTVSGAVGRAAKGAAEVARTANARPAPPL